MFFFIVCLFIAHINYFCTRFEVLVGLTEDYWDVTSSHWASVSHISKNHGAFILRILQWRKKSQHGTKVGVTYITVLLTGQ